jgi:hypothetical protein
MATASQGMSIQEFDRLFESVRTWGRWGPRDELGTLNYITPEHVRSAASLVREGRSVSLPLDINTVAGPDNPRPATHAMTRAHDVAEQLEELRFAADYLASECHGHCHTRLDALCHVSYRGLMYNGVPADSVTSQGPTRMDIRAYAHGIVGRSVRSRENRCGSSRSRVRWLP